MLRLHLVFFQNFGEVQSLWGIWDSGDPRRQLTANFRMEQTLLSESSENQAHVFDSMNHSDRVEEPAMIIDVCQNIDWIYGPGVFARFIRVFNTRSACAGVSASSLSLGRGVG